MSFSVFLHQDVERYLDSLLRSERERCYVSLKRLSEDPFQSRSGSDIRKMTGTTSYYRLRVGNHRFLYIVRGDEVLIEEAFQRGSGY